MTFEIEKEWLEDLASRLQVSEGACEFMEAGLLALKRKHESCVIPEDASQEVPAIPKLGEKGRLGILIAEGEDAVSDMVAWMEPLLEQARHEAGATDFDDFAWLRSAGLRVTEEEIDGGMLGCSSYHYVWSDEPKRTEESLKSLLGMVIRI